MPARFTLPALPALAAGSLLALCPTPDADAAVVAQWDFASDLSASTVGSGLDSASAVGGVNSGLTPVSRSGGSGIEADGSGLPIDNADPAGPDGRAFGRAWLSDGNGDYQHYFDWSVSVTAGQQLDLDNVTVDLGARSNGPDEYKLEYSTTSDFSSGVVLITPSAAESPFVGGDAPDDANFDWQRVTHNTNLGGNEALTGDVYFRLWLRGGSTADNGDSNFYLDNLTLNGAVIPEPGSLALMGLGGLLILGRRRTRA